LRHIVKFLIPNSIGGRAKLEDIHSHPIRFEALDLPENPTRIRLHTTVVRVEHLGKPENADHVQVTYLRDGKLWRLRARAVVMAVGGWVNRRVVRDLPGEKLAAFQQFLHSSMLVVNVAVTNWRFLYKLGLTGGRWFDVFGYFCNLRKQMVIGDYRPKLDPDFPNILTFYVPFYAPGKPASEQVALGRTKLFSTSFAEYERQIRETLARVFGMSGFNPKKDIAGIVLNRWGHSVVVPVPGFMFGRNGEPAAREIAWKPFGRIGFAHSELQGGQSFGGAISHARRATSEVLDRL
jgi:spermidine dehydrogenase